MQNIIVNPELKKRVTIGLALGALLIIVIFGLPVVFTYLLALACSLLGWREYTRMMGLTNRPGFWYGGYFILTLIFTYAILNTQVNFFWIWFLWVFGFFNLLLEPQLLKRFDGKIVETDPVRDWTSLCRFILGILYIFMMFGFVGPISAAPGGEEKLTLGLSVVFLGDISAYFVGKSHGRRKLWEALSPKKTVEGAIAGWLGSFIGAVLVWSIFYAFKRTAHLSLEFSMLFGFLAAPLAQAGDFLESLMKRVAGLKDSGTLLPGHGGILDRTDGLVFALPLLYFLS